MREVFSLQYMPTVLYCTRCLCWPRRRTCSAAQGKKRKDRREVRRPHAAPTRSRRTPPGSDEWAPPRSGDPLTPPPSPFPSLAQVRALRRSSRALPPPPPGSGPLHHHTLAGKRTRSRSFPPACQCGSSASLPIPSHVERDSRLVRETVRARTAAPMSAGVEAVEGAAWTKKEGVPARQPPAEGCVQPVFRMVRKRGQPWAGTSWLTPGGQPSSKQKPVKNSEHTCESALTSSSLRMPGAAGELTEKLLWCKLHGFLSLMA